MVVAGFNHVYFCCKVLSLTWESMWIDSLLEPAPRGHLRNCSFWNLQKKKPVGTVVQERRSIVFLENGMRIATLTFSFLHIFFLFFVEFVKIYS